MFKIPQKCVMTIGGVGPKEPQKCVKAEEGISAQQTAEVCYGHRNSMCGGLHRAGIQQKT